jgi:hypothetical protein
MQYLVLLYDDETAMAMPGTPEFDAELAGYEAFGELAGPAIVGGEALEPSNTTRTIRIEEGRVTVTDGPFAESAEVLGGFYVLDVPTLDDCIELARNIPAASTGRVEIRPLASDLGQSSDPAPDGALRYIATLHGTETEAEVPGTAAWDEAATAHWQFASDAGSAVAGGAAVQPLSTASTIRVRDGELHVADGPAVPEVAVVGGVYLLTAAPDVAANVAAMIPMPADGAVELRPIMEIGG